MGSCRTLQGSRLQGLTLPSEGGHTEACGRGFRRHPPPTPTLPRARPAGCLVLWEPRSQEQRLGETRCSLSGAAVLLAQRLFVRQWRGHKSRLSPAAQLMRTLKRSQGAPSAELSERNRGHACKDTGLLPNLAQTCARPRPPAPWGFPTASRLVCAGMLSRRHPGCSVHAGTWGGLWMAGTFS